MQKILTCILLFTLLFFNCFNLDHLAVNDRMINSNNHENINTISPIHVSGNQILDSNNNPVVLKGIALADPANLYWEGHWNEEYFQKAKEWGAQILRIPVQPDNWQNNMGPDNYLPILDQAVSWAKKYQLYLIIDWHSIGSLYEGVFQEQPPQYDYDIYFTDTNKTKAFWRTIAERYKNEPVVAFYEIFNEPLGHGDPDWNNDPNYHPEHKSYTTTWDQWKNLADEIITEIYQINPSAIPIVGGFNYAYNLKEAMANPLTNTGVVYSVHPYFDHQGYPFENGWDEYFGNMTANYPVFATEFGLGSYSGGYNQEKDINYAIHILNYLETKNISWTIWCFHITCNPTLILNWNYTPTLSGEFFKSALQDQYFSRITKIVHDFENASGLYTYNEASSSIQISQEPTTNGILREGNYCEKILFNNQDYCGFGINCNGDWSTKQGLAFWFKGCNSGNTVRVEIIDNGGERFICKFIDSSSNWIWKEFSFNSFIRRDDYQPVGAPNDGFTKTAIEGIIFSPINNDSGTWYIDWLGIY